MALQQSDTFVVVVTLSQERFTQRMATYIPITCPFQVTVVECCPRSLKSLSRPTVVSCPPSPGDNLVRTGRVEIDLERELFRSKWS